MQREEGFVIGSGNVFADLGLDDPEELLLKAKLVQRISHVIRDNGWTQKEAAAVLGVDQPKVSALTRGKLSGFSTDRLLRFIGALGYEVIIELRPKPTSQDNGKAAMAESVAVDGEGLRVTEKVTIS